VSSVVRDSTPPTDLHRRGFHTITLGCKLNQFDGAAIEGELEQRGFLPQPDRARAAVVVINTCTVTHKADAEARRLIRSVRRHNPTCWLLVTGCYAELDPERLAAIDGVDRVFGNRDKPRLGSILDELGLGHPGSGGPSSAETDLPERADRGCDASLALPRALHFGDRSRAFLKIQEGCRLVCSYCIIPRVRGTSRSVAPDDVERGLGTLLVSGYREVVLTGVNSGDYGLDLPPATDLATLLRRLLASCGPNRIRLNSLEPLTITDEIIDLMAAEPRLAPHLQVPLQSGSEPILRLMRRNYRMQDYLERLQRLRRAVPEVGLGADVIVGFPGETETMFRETFEFIERSPLNYLHVFSWSPRPGTPAADLPDRVAPAKIRERSTRLRSLGDRIGFRFRKRFEGQRLDAIALGARPGDGRIRALTGNFIEVSLDPGAAERGEPVEVGIERVTPGETQARRLGRPLWAAHDAPIR
jgi:threonylcarbamoyladenosine tRNA methylthiotransferase MtaB